jgi:hypothetical protein
MKGYFLNRKLLALASLALLLLAALPAKAAVHNHNFVPFLGDVRGPTCSATDPTVGIITAETPLDTPLFNRTNRGGLGTPACSPILDPNGNQVTLGQFTAVRGSAKVMCTSMGTRSVLHFSGLVPNGTYTVWLFLVGDPSPPPSYVGAGSLGRTSPTENFFTANAGGEGEISRTTPAQVLSAFGQVGACFLDGVVELHLVYHSDGMTHGPGPGPLQTWVVNGRFFIPDFSGDRGKEE